MCNYLFCTIHKARIIKTISKGVVLIISPFLKKLYCRSSYLLYNQNNTPVEMQQNAMLTTPFCLASSRQER